MCEEGDCFLDWIVSLQKEVSMADLEMAGERKPFFPPRLQIRSYCCPPPRHPWVKGAAEVPNRLDHAQTFFVDYCCLEAWGIVKVYPNHPILLL